MDVKDVIPLPGAPQDWSGVESEFPSVLKSEDWWSLGGSNS
jgi:hypothetical protein